MLDSPSGVGVPISFSSALLARWLLEPPPTPHGHLPASSCSNPGRLLKLAWPPSPVNGYGGRKGNEREAEVFPTSDSLPEFN